MDDFDGVIAELRTIWTGLIKDAESALDKLFPYRQNIGYQVSVAHRAPRSVPSVLWSGHAWPQVQTTVPQIDIGPSSDGVPHQVSLQFDLPRRGFLFIPGVSASTQHEEELVSTVARVADLIENPESATQHPVLHLQEMGDGWRTNPNYLGLPPPAEFNLYCVNIAASAVNLNALRAAWPDRKQYQERWFFNYQREQAKYHQKDVIDPDLLSRDPEYLTGAEAK